MALLALIVAIGLLGMGCSGGEDSADTSSTSANSPTTVIDGSDSTDGSDAADEPSGGLDPEEIAKAEAEAAANGTAVDPPKITGASVPDSPDTPTTEYVEAKSGLPDVAPTNGRGDPIVLDETALLACAQNQIAWVETQSGNSDRATEALTLAARRAETSAVPEIKDFAATLKKASTSSSPKADIDRFLKLCTDRGFEY